MKKKLFQYILLCIVFALVFIPTMAQEAKIEDFTSGDWNYIENKTGITLTAYQGSDIEIVIPEILDGKTVNQLQNNLFSNKTDLVSVVIPDSVKTIGNNVFYGCSSLKEVRLPYGLAKIANNVFRFCIALEHVDIPFSVTSIGDNAFADCIKLKEIMLISVSTIGTSAFDNCLELENVTLSKKISSIGAHAFRDTAWLDAQTDEFVLIGKGILIRYSGNQAEVQVPYGTTMVIDAFEDNYFVETISFPDTVLQIGANACLNAYHLKTVNLPQFLNAIGANAFSGCQSLETINIPNSITTIGANAFTNCRSLESIELPEGLMTLGASVFSNCTSLKSITIPSTVTSLPSSILANCPMLTDVVISGSVGKIDMKAFTNSPKVHLTVEHGTAGEIFAQENEIPYDYSIQEKDGFVYARDDEGVHILRYKGNLLDVEVPAQINNAQVVSIEDGAFQNNDRVRRIEIPLTVKTIGDWTFSEMDSLQIVQFPISITTLGSHVFTGSTEIKEIRIPKGVQEIGDMPFDSDTPTLICADADSKAALRLTELGYEVQPEGACSNDEEILALWAELTSLENTSSVCACPEEQKTESQYEEYEIIRIPDDIQILTPGLLTNAGKSLVLIIPAEVAEILPDILDEHEIVTIVSGTGSAAETFAVEHDIRFLVQYTYLLNPRN